MLRSQRYSDLVFKNITAMSNAEGETSKKYKSLCKRAGGIFRTVGLIQFMAFIEAKSAKEDNYKILAEHLRRELKELNLVQDYSPLKFMEAIREMSLPAYMHISRSVLQLLQWHKRIAEIMIEGDSHDCEDKE